MQAAVPAPQPTPTRQHTRLDALDVVRAVAAIAVVLIHTSAGVLFRVPPGTRAYELAGLINQFARFAVPAFVLMTGAGLFYNYGHRPEFAWPQYYLRRAKSLGLPYLFWSAIYFGYFRWMQGDYSHLFSGLASVLVSAGAVYTFYFFPIILPFYVLFPLVRPLARSKWLGLATLIAIVGNGFFVWFSFPHPKFPLGPFLSELYPYAGNTPLWWMGPFFLGGWLALRWGVVSVWLRRLWLPLFAVAGILLFWMMREFHTYVRLGKAAYVATNFRPSAYTYGLVLIVALIGLGGVLVARGERLKSAIVHVSKYSFSVYLIHPLVMELTTERLRMLPLSPIGLFTVQTGLAIGGAYLIARLIEKVPGGSWVIGVR